MNQPPRPVIPVWFLNAEGLKVVRQAAKALREYLWALRQAREIRQMRGAR